MARAAGPIRRAPDGPGRAAGKWGYRGGDVAGLEWLQAAGTAALARAVAPSGERRLGGCGNGGERRLAAARILRGRLEVGGGLGLG